MRKMLLFLVIGWSAAPTAQAQPNPTADPFVLRKTTLTVGQVAPDFELQDVEGKNTVQLSKLKGKPVVLIFGSCS